jgi:hypothetical protein
MLPPMGFFMVGVLIGGAISIIVLAVFIVATPFLVVAQLLLHPSPEQLAARAEGKARAARISARGEALRQRQLAWMERHWATRWCARLNRSIVG